MADPWDNDPIVQPQARRQQATANPWDADPVVQPAQRQQSAVARQPAPQINFANDRDALIRTVLGEARGEPPEGQAAVAAVVLNRARGRNLTPSQVVLERNQFEPWGNPDTARRLMSISPDDPAYQRAAAQVDRALQGFDPTNGADHFFAPVAQQALGRNVPSWAAGQPSAVIGGHNFYSLGGSTEDVRLAAADGGMAEPMMVEDAMPADMAASEPGAPGSSQETAIDLNAIRYDDQVRALRKGAWVRNGNEVYQLPGDAFTDNARASDEAVQGNIFIRRPNLQDQVGNFAQAFTEQIPFGDEAVAGAVGLVSGQGYDAIRQRQAASRELGNQTDRGARVAGGVGGFATGLLAPGAGYIGRGATGAQRASRAAQVGGAYGGLYGAGAADDSYASRLSGLTQGAAVGAATGGLLQQGGERLVASAQRSINRPPSRARLLSREGVDLTPGQMLADVPVIGPTARALEEGASSIPFVGQPIAGARQQSVESFSTAAVNRALAPIGERVPRNVEPGYASVEYAQQAFSRAYDDVLRDVNLTIDQDLIDSISPVLVQVAEESGEPQARALANQIRNRLFRGVDYVGDAIDGQQFKALESEFGNLARESQSAADGATRNLGRAYGEIRDALRQRLEAQNPQAAARLQEINQGYASLSRVNDAASSTAAFADDGVFTPTQLGRAVARGGSTNQLARGDALMQDLAAAGRGVIPSRTGDSGTATRGAVTGLIAAGASGTPLGPLVAPVVVTSIAYSRPAQRALNAAYRAADNPGALQRHLARLANLAQREPALQPYYQEAVRALTGQEPLRPSRPASATQATAQRPAA